MADVDIRWDYDGLARLYLLIDERGERLVGQIADDMRRLVPVDTGALRSSIEDTYVDPTGVITVGTDYWRYVEYGTRYMDAQPYIRPALYRKRSL